MAHEDGAYIVSGRRVHASGRGVHAPGRCSMHVLAVAPFHRLASRLAATLRHAKRDGIPDHNLIHVEQALYDIAACIRSKRGEAATAAGAGNSLAPAPPRIQQLAQLLGNLAVRAQGPAMPSGVVPLVKAIGNESVSQCGETETVLATIPPCSAAGVVAGAPEASEGSGEGRSTGVDCNAAPLLGEFQNRRTQAPPESVPERTVPHVCEADVAVSEHHMAVPDEDAEASESSCGGDRAGLELGFVGMQDLGQLASASWHHYDVALRMGWCILPSRGARDANGGRDS